MFSVEFERKITIGNLLSAGVLTVAVLGAYFTLDNRTSVNTDNIASANARVTALDARLSALVDSVNTDRLGLARQLTQVQADVGYMKSAIDDVRRSQRETGGQ